MSSDAVAAISPPPADVLPFDFGATYAREFDWVWHTLRRLGVAPRNLADVTHDVFVVVLRRGHTYDPARPMRPWLFGVAYRVARDHLALGRNRHESVVEAPEALAPDDPQDQHVEKREARELIIAALQHLELDHRVVFILHDLEERPMTEIAASLETPLKTLYARLDVARQQFTAAVRRIRLRRGERP